MTKGQAEYIGVDVEGPFMPESTTVVSCVDGPGIVSRISTFLHRRGGREEFPYHGAREGFPCLVLAGEILPPFLPRAISPCPATEPERPPSSAGVGLTGSPVTKVACTGKVLKTHSIRSAERVQGRALAWEAV